MFDLSYHPSLPLFAAGLITGELQLYRMECKLEGAQRRQARKDSADRKHRDKRPKPPTAAEQDDEDEGGQQPPGAAAGAAGREESVESELSSEDEAALPHPDCLGSPPLLYQCCPHTASIRSLAFSPSGSRLYTASSDQSVSVFAVSPSASASASPLTLLTSIPAAHSTAINVVRAWAGSGGDLLATGDDDGFVRVWDTRLWNKGKANEAASERQRGSDDAETAKGRKRRRRTGQSDETKAAAAQATTAAMSFAESGDYISDICVEAGSHKLLCTSGDGHLQVFDLRRAGKWFAQSEGVEDDLLSVIVIDRKSGRGRRRRAVGGGEGGGDERRKVVVGSKESGVRVFSWGWFGLPDSHFAFAESADVLLELPSPSAHNLLCIASSDGNISLCSLWPHRTLHRIGRHAGGQPVESACLSGRVSAGDGLQEESQWLLSAGHDRRIRMWDMTAVCDDGWDFTNEQGDEEEEEEEEEEGVEEAEDQEAEEEEEEEDSAQDEGEAATATATTTQPAADSDDEDDDDDDSGVATSSASAAPTASSKRAAAGLRDRAQLVAFLKRRLAAKEQKQSGQTTQPTAAESSGVSVAGDGNRAAAMRGREKDKKRDKKTRVKAEKKKKGGGGGRAGGSGFFDGL